MTRRHLVLWLVPPVLASLAGALAYVSVYLAGHREMLEAGATKILGRPVEIGGVALSWSLRPVPTLSVSLTGLSVSNPEWAKAPRLAHAQRVDLQLDLRALLQRRVEIEGLVIQGADVDLESDRAGQNNWTFAPGPGAGDGVQLQIRGIQARDSLITLRTADGYELKALIARADMTGLGAGRLGIDADLTLRDTALSLDAALGQAGQAPGQGWPFHIRARAQASEIDVQGNTGAAFDPAVIDAHVRMKGPTTAPLGRLIGIGALPEGAYSLAFRLTRDGPRVQLTGIAGSLDARALPDPVTLTSGDASFAADGPWSASLQGRIGELPATLALSPAALAQDPGQGPTQPPRIAIIADLADHHFDGDLRLASSEAPPRLSGKLALGELHLDDSAMGVASERARSGPAPASGPPSRAPWLETTLPVTMLSKFDADLSISVKGLRWGVGKANGIRSRAELRGGRLALDRLTAALPGLTLTGQASIDAAGRVPALSVALRSDRIDLARAVAAFTNPPTIRGTFNRVELTAKTRGDSPIALIRDLEGRLRATSAELQMPSGKDRKPTEIRLREPVVAVTSGQGVGLKTGLTAAGLELGLELTGGPLADLLLQPRPWPRIRIAAHGEIDGERFEINGHAGPLRALLAGRNLHLDLDLSRPPARSGSAEGLAGRVTGTLARVGDLSGSRLRLQASGPDLAALNPLLQLELPEQPFQATARVEGQRGRLDFVDLRLTSAGSDIEGRVGIRLGQPPGIDAQLAAGTLDLTPFMDAAGIGGIDRLTGSGKTMVSTAGAGPGPGSGSGPADAVAPRLPLDGLLAFDGALQLRAGHVRAGDFGLDDGILDASLDAGHLSLVAKAGQERLSLHLDVRPEQDRWRVDLRHKGKLDLGWLIEADNQRAPPSLPASIDLRLRGAGETMPALLRSARGRIQVVLGAGRFAQSTSRLPLGGVLLALLSTLNPVDLRKQAVGLHCAVLQFEVADGIATSHRGLALQTEAFNVLGGGAINLQSSEIALRFKTAKRKGIGLNLLGIADKFIYISGTLEHPRAAIDHKDLLIEGAAAWATSGLSLVADQILQRLSAFGNPCDTVLGGRAQN